ncbi:MAG: hypothetical protein IPK13_11870 [Deltaproteobacteria bacterium]|nr:hypothetical protein [Deltaproteobacteria bacterium]
MAVFSYQLGLSGLGLWCAVSLLSVVLVPSSAGASGELGKVAVLDMQTTDVPPGLVGVLTEVLTAEVQDADVFDEVIAGRDVAALVGFERQRQLVGCSEESCMSEIAGALGVDRILVSQVAKVGSSFVLNLKMLEVRTGRAGKRIYETMKADEDVLIRTIRASVQKLLLVRLDAEVPSGTSQSWSIDITKDVPPTSGPSGPGTLSLVGFGVGLAAGVTGAVFGVMARGHYANTTDPDFVGSQLEVAPGKADALIANISFGVAIAATVAAVAFWLFPGEVSRDPNSER